ncbi:unnamed protein product [Brachionus calyciflorus]|uniref:Uncharacterized protein n=1 Tax=Brachionus calyciflorus TaxID=104777 RepID=A0A813VN95_9BILA|nr:unnamed protein product [Brachionus calyciflorus]
MYRFKFNHSWTINPSTVNPESDDHFNRHLETITFLDQEEINSIKPVDNEEKDEDDDQNVDDEPKVFQDEEVLDEINEPIFLKKNESFTIGKFTSVIPTPLAYSRSSSLTSLNSFDVESIHSTIESEYSHLPKNNDDKSRLDLDDDLEDFPDSTVALVNLQLENKNKSLSMSDNIESVMSNLSLNECNNPLTKTIPKFLQNKSPSAFIQYGFLKNLNTKSLNSPRFLTTCNSYQRNSNDNFSKVSSIDKSPQDAKYSLTSLKGDKNTLSYQKLNSALDYNPKIKILLEKLNIPVVNFNSQNIFSESNDKKDDAKCINKTDLSCILLEEKLQEEKNNSVDTECLYSDYDLENFINENFVPTIRQVKDVKSTPKRVTPRSSDINLNKPKSNICDQKNKKCGNNSKNSPLTKRKPNDDLISPTIFSLSRPIVNMTKTAQLRASKVNKQILNSRATKNSGTNNQQNDEKIKTKSNSIYQSKGNQIYSRQITIDDKLKTEDIVTIKESMVFKNNPNISKVKQVVRIAK